MTHAEDGTGHLATSSSCHVNINEVRGFHVLWAYLMSYDSG